MDGGVREPLGSALVPTANRLGKGTEERADMCACACVKERRWFEDFRAKGTMGVRI